MNYQTHKNEILTSVQLTAINAASGIFLESNFSYLDKSTKSLREYYNIKLHEATILSIYFDLELKEEPMTHEKVLKYLGEDIRYLPQFISICEDLVRKRILIYTSNNFSWYKKKSGYRSYRIHYNLIKGIFDDKTNDVTSKSEVSHFYDFLDELNELYMLCANRHISSTIFFDELFNSIEYSKQLPEVAWISGLKGCSKIDIAILVYLIIDYYKGIIELDLDLLLRDIFEKVKERMQYKDELRQGRNQLFKKNLITLIDNSNIQFTNVIQLSADVKNILLKNTTLNSIKRFNASIGCVYLHEKIKHEKLYYNVDEEEQITGLKTALEAKAYESITNHLSANKICNGIICLFYGSPGTGKTSSALQIAREVQRDVLMVNMENIHSKWVGESEKNIAKIFDEYNALCQISSQTPILLFNEGDAIIGKRVSVNSVVDQMHNSVQNILLQKLEDFKGILLITTNLTVNFDKAFDRRILYKIHFRNPSYDVKYKIIQDVFEPFSFDSRDLRNIAKFDLTGSNIYNIKKKYVIESILRHGKNKIEELVKIAKEELSLTSTHKLIGFHSQAKYT
jgi:ATP-dependent 26S proteasome regulatory subunit